MADLDARGALGDLLHEASWMEASTSSREDEVQRSPLSE
jgi:hypothetical protein